MEQLVDWIESEIREYKLSGHVHKDSIREDGEWYYVPVYVELRDAYEKATILQKIEASWDTQQLQPGRNLLLIPAAN